MSIVSLNRICLDSNRIQPFGRAATAAGYFSAHFIFKAPFYSGMNFVPLDLPGAHLLIERKLPIEAWIMRQILVKQRGWGWYTILERGRTSNGITIGIVQLPTGVDFRETKKSAINESSV